jgi:hypothetical protein
MLSYAFSHFNGALGISRGMFSLTRGFTTLPDSGEGFGRSLPFDDIKKDKRVKVVETPSPKSIDDIVLVPSVFTAGKLENSLVDLSYVAMPKANSATVLREIYSALPFNAEPRLVDSTRAATLVYSRTLQDYAPTLQEYGAVANIPSQATTQYSVPKAYVASLVGFYENTRYRQNVQRTYVSSEQKVKDVPIVAPVYIPSVIAKAQEASIVAPVIITKTEPKLKEAYIEKPTLDFKIRYQPMPVQQVRLPTIPAIRERIAQVYHAPVNERALPKIEIAPRLYRAPVAPERHTAPILTAVGVSFSPLSLQHPPEIPENISPLTGQEDISMIVEKSKPLLRAVEKIKRVQPTYERKDLPPELEHIAKEIEAKYGAQVSLQVIDLKKGYSFGRNNEQVIPPASLSKLGIVYAVMKLAQEGKIDLQKEYAIGRFVNAHPELMPKNKGNLKDSYTLSDMLEIAARDWRGKSNVVSTYLLHLLGDKVNSILEKNGFAETKFAGSYSPKGGYQHNTSTLDEIGRFLYELSTENKWSPEHWNVLKQVLKAHESWAPLLFGSKQTMDGKQPTIFLKQGGTKDSMSLAARYMDGQNDYMFLWGVTGTKDPIVGEDYRKATPTGVSLVNDGFRMNRAMASNTAMFNYK